MTNYERSILRSLIRTGKARVNWSKMTTAKAELDKLEESSLLTYRHKGDVLWAGTDDEVDATTIGRQKISKLLR